MRYPDAMSTNVKIEVDEQTAAVAVGADEIAELDQRWKKIETGGNTVPHDRVVRWLRTWGSPISSVSRGE